MRKILASLLVAGSLVSSPAMADRHGHHGGYNPWIPFVAGAGLTYLATRPAVVYTQPQVVYTTPAPVLVYPTQAPVVQSQGQVCELRSEMVNGQIVTGNFCYYR